MLEEGGIGMQEPLAARLVTSGSFQSASRSCSLQYTMLSCTVYCYYTFVDLYTDLNKSSCHLHHVVSKSVFCTVICP